MRNQYETMDTQLKQELLNIEEQHKQEIDRITTENGKEVQRLWDLVNEKDDRIKSLE